MDAPRVIGAATCSPELAAVATRLASLEDVVRRPDLMVVDVVVQDEFTHDVVVAVGALAAPSTHLVYDST